MVTTLSIGAAAVTLRAWRASGFLVPIYRTEGGHRRYEIETLRREGQSTLPINDLTINFLDQEAGVYHSVSINVRPLDEPVVREWLEGRLVVLERMRAPVS